MQDYFEESQRIPDPQETALDWSNEQVHHIQIPSIATLEYSGLQPGYRIVSILSTALFFGFLGLVIVALYFSADRVFMVEYGLIIVAAVSLLAILSFVYVAFAFKRKKYALRERDIIFEEGLIFQSSTVIPFNRVQHCEISQGPIERLFGLSELKVFTAGGATSDMSIPGLEPETATRLKEYIVMKTGQSDEEE